MRNSNNKELQYLNGNWDIKNEIFQNFNLLTSCVHAMVNDTNYAARFHGRKCNIMVCR